MEDRQMQAHWPCKLDHHYLYSLFCSKTTGGVPEHGATDNSKVAWRPWLRLGVGLRITSRMKLKRGLLGVAGLTAAGLAASRRWPRSEGALARPEPHGGAEGDQGEDWHLSVSRQPALALVHCVWGRRPPPPAAAADVDPAWPSWLCRTTCMRPLTTRRLPAGAWRTSCARRAGPGSSSGSRRRRRPPVAAMAAPRKIAAAAVAAAVGSPPLLPFLLNSWQP